MYFLTFFIHPAFSTLVLYNKAFESKEAKWIQDNWSIFEKSSAYKNCHRAVSDMTKKLYSLLLILIPKKKVHAFQKFLPVLVTIVAINYEEMLKKDLASKYFLGVSVVVIRTNPLQWLIMCCQVYFLSLLSFTHESTKTEEHFREIDN